MQKIRKIKIYGERNSGTRYLTKLIELNLDVDVLPGSVPRVIRMLAGRNEALRDLYFRATYAANLGWKHAMAPSPEQLTRLNVDGVLFVTLTKNPYAWLLSLARRPYHGQHVANSFATFLQSEWPTVGRELHAHAFPNPIVMWNEKNRSYLALNDGALACNLRYEDVVRDPESAMNALATTGALSPKRATFENITRSTKPDAKQFDQYQSFYVEEQWRTMLDAEMLALINHHLDKEVMHKLRYEMLLPNPSTEKQDARQEEK